MRFRRKLQPRKPTKSRARDRRLDPRLCLRPLGERLEPRAMLSGDPSLSLTLSPHTVAENAGPGAVSGSITRNNMDTSQALTVNLTSSDPSHATVASSVTIAAGATSAAFTVNPIDDNLVDGAHTVSITGFAPSPVAVGLDPTFGSGGYSSVPLTANSSADIPRVKIAPDGSIVGVASPASGTSGTWAVTRTLASGAADTSFGGTGTVVTTFPGAKGGTANAVAFQPDGKIVVAGIINGTNPYDTWGVARYNSDGTLDTSFGTAGLYQFSFNSANGYGGWAYSVAVQTDGKILVGGMLRGVGMGFSVGRLTSGGQLDTTFGRNGIASVDVDPSSGYNKTGQAMLLEPDGSIVMTGIANYNYLAVARFTSGGAVDTTFNGNGVKLISYSAFGPSYNLIVGYGLALQPDGKLIAVGKARSTNTSFDFVTARLNSDGSLDTGFNGNGLSAVDFFGYDDTAYGAVIQPDGKIVVGGQASTGLLALVRYNPNGTLDASFNGSGKLTIKPPDPFEALWGIDLESDGKLVGIAEGASTAGSFTQIVRFDTGLLAASDALSVTNTDGAGTPIAADDAYSLNENGTLSVAAPGVLANDTAANSTPLSAVLVTGPSHGSLTLNADGSFSYTPAASFSGTDSFIYDDTEGSLTSNTATVTLTVNPLPVATNDNYSVNENSSLTVAAPGVLANDTAANSTPLSAVVVSAPSHGALAFGADGSFTYTPAGNFSGTDSFTYDDTEGSLTSNTATVRLTVNPVPVATADNYSVNENSSLTVAAHGVLANDLSANSTPLSAVLVAAPSHGTLTFNADGSFSYTPTAGFYGTDSFTYDDTEGNLTSNTATVTLTVNQVPVAVDDSYTTNENTPLVVGIVPGVSSLTMQSQPGDFVGQGKTYNFTSATGAFSVSSPYNHELVFAYQDKNPNEWWYLTFVAPFGNPLAPGVYDNAARAPFQASSQPGLDVSGDGRGSNTLTGSFVVDQAVYDASGNILSFDATFVQHCEGATPALTGEIKYNAAPIMTGVLSNDVAVNSTPLSAVLVAGPNHGTVSLNANGSFTYTPATEFDGTDSFTYYDTEGSLVSNTATVNITVNEVPPTATFGNNGPVNEASPVTVSFTDPFSPSQADTQAGFHYSFAVSTAGLATSYAAAGTASSAPFTFAEDGTYTVYGRIFDSDGSSTDYSTVVTVNEVPPTATFGNSGPVNEASPVTVSFTNPFSPSQADTQAGFHYGFALSAAALATSYASAGTASSAPFTFAEDGTYTVYGRIFDSDGSSTDYSTVVTVNEVPPT
ncbi:MAG TPA: Ig-like domain-containing protein, partial [Pirellulales bacterium]|nr:Ig-like domain-containing protein [Pirellulales bacterium]